MQPPQNPHRRLALGPSPGTKTIRSVFGVSGRRPASFGSKAGLRFALVVPFFSDPEPVSLGIEEVGILEKVEEDEVEGEGSGEDGEEDDFEEVDRRAAHPRGKGGGGGSRRVRKGIETLLAFRSEEATCGRGGERGEGDECGWR
jgi:hypothetical protein